VQACVTHSLLQANATDPELRIEYPLERMAKTVDLVTVLPRNTLLCNGHVMGKKLHTIADNADFVLALPKLPPLPSDIGSLPEAFALRDTLRQVANEVGAQLWFRWDDVGID